MRTYGKRSDSLFQSTLPQGKWRWTGWICRKLWEISIHTSAREVTNFPLALSATFRISIHTSAREVTQVPVMQKTGKLYFNPHFRKGSDHNYTVVYAVFMISIHTSAREVTNPDPKLDPVSYISIHTSAREVTSDLFLMDHAGLISIHTSAREVTLLIR